MSATIPGLGKRNDVPKQAPNPSFSGLNLQPEDWFLLSRIDGVVDIEALFLLSPKKEQETIEMLRRLFSAKLILLPSAEVPVEIKSPSKTSGRGALRATPPASGKKKLLGLGKFTIPSSWPIPFASFSFDQSLLQLDVPLELDLKKAILYIYEQLEEISYYKFFGLEPGVEKRALRRSYLRFSKIFHPDRFFRMELGEFSVFIDVIFRWANEGHQILGDPSLREEYDEILEEGYPGPWAIPEIDVETEPPQPHAFAKIGLQQRLQMAKGCEKEKDYEGAYKHYEAALGQRQSPEVMNRAAECLIRLRANLHVAIQYARSATEAEPGVARYWVTLAYTEELDGKTQAAIRHYQRALELQPEHRAAKRRLSVLSQK